MSACGLILANPPKEVSKMSTEQVKGIECLQIEEDKNSNAGLESDTEGDLKTEQPKKRISYTKDELLDLRAAPLSLKRPECLADEYFVRNGVWDPIAWHESAASRSSSPAVDGKCVTFEHGKKIELFDDTIELAPHRRSFCQGCHVQSTSESESTEKGGLIRRLRASSNNESKLISIEGKDRLTGRAASQRKNIEKAILRDRENQNSDGRRVIKVIQDARNPEENGEKRRDFVNAKGHKSNTEKDRNERQRMKGNEKELRVSGRDRTNSGRDNCNSAIIGDQKRKSGNLPEWMTDGPISQNDFIELKGFNDEIEEERKALMKDNKKQSNSNEDYFQHQQQQQQQQQQRSRKSSKGSSRSSTPVEKKQNQKPKNKEDQKKNSENDDGKRVETSIIGSRKRHSPSDKLFDENGLFDVMDYLPTHLFNDDYPSDPASHSKFSRWFQSQSANNSDHSRPNSGHLGFGLSPTGPMQYFTPIQPAPATQMFERPIPVSPLMEIFSNNTQAPIAKPKEVKGRITVNEIEQEFPKPIGSKPPKPVDHDAVSSAEQNAFDKLVFTMKAAGQLPEKPAPVVSGLPEHLLPKPPKRTSPSFEKLKRALSRSPSPIHSGRISPLNFMNRPVSPLITPISQRLISPEFFQLTAQQRAMQSNSLFNRYPENPHPANQANHRMAQQQQHEQRRFDNEFRTPEHFATPKQQQPKLPTAFLPTSVIKKMHSEKQDHKERADSFSKFDLSRTGLGHPPGLPAHNTPSTEAPSAFNILSANDQLLDGPTSKRNTLMSAKLFDDMLGDKNDNAMRPNPSLLPSNFPQSSAPTSPRANARDHEENKPYHSAPVTPFHADPTSAPSASQIQQRRAVESTSAFFRPLDKFGVPKIGNEVNKDASFNIPIPGQRLPNRPDPLVASTQGNHHAILNDNRADNDARMKIAAPISQQKSQLNSAFMQNDSQRMNFPNAQQRLPPSQQMQRQLQPNQFNQFQRGRGSGPRLPVPMNQPSALNPTLNARPKIPDVTAAMAAQIVQQRILQQAVRAHAIQTAQAIQQQQQQNILRTQMQAAMAQAYAREQAKAMMYNPRAVASNLQAVAQQMGLRPPHPSAQGKGLPTPMLNQANGSDKNDMEAKPADVAENPSKTKESPLSKWFNVDAIQKTPPTAQVDPAAKSKAISLEELERSQR